uniref:Uncharacterized protein n=1 Tax=Macrostomum lignano TaxID=282301 RepID=A0A1I8IJQ2_9PLAT
MKRKLSKKRENVISSSIFSSTSFNRKAMATKTVTATRVNSLVLHFSIPVAEERCSRREEDPTRGSTSSAPADTTDVATTATASSSTAQPGFEGDNISPAYFRRMRPAPGPSDGSAPSTAGCGAAPDGGPGASGSAGVGLLRPVRDRDLLKKSAGKSCGFAKKKSIGPDRTLQPAVHPRRTLLLRGTHSDQNLGQVLQCAGSTASSSRFLKRCFRLLEQFDAAFCTRHRCQHERDRVTALLLNRSVPENTSLRVSRQRLRKIRRLFWQDAAAARPAPGQHGGPVDPVLREQQLAAGPAGRLGALADSGQRGCQYDY